MGRTTLALLTAAALFGGCENATEDTAGESADVVATVNGTPITEQALEAYIRQRRVMQPQIRLNKWAALDDLVKLKLIEQQAEQEGVHQRDAVQAELDWQRTNLLVNTFIREHMANMSFSEEELKAEYRAQVAQLSDQHYKARHILTETRKEAEEIIKQLEGGADFLVLSEKRSSAPSAPQGGDLGWFSPDQMVPPLAEAVKTLEGGEYTKEPVKTRFGWHVILLEDSRNMKPPAFEKVRDRVENILASNALQAYINKLYEEAQVDIKLKPEAQRPNS
jgi:peptidyl-prolyl cis-trans isomerase C